MSLWSRLAAPFRRTKMTVDDWMQSFGSSSSTTTGIVVNQLSALQSSAVMACVSILSEDVAKLPVHVFRLKPNGGKDIIENHPLELLLKKPNSWQTRFEFFENLMAALLLRGNAYAAIIRDSRGRPTAMIPINPDRVWIYESPDGSIFYMVSRRGPHDMAVLQSLPLMVPSEDMLHIRWLSLDNSLYGMSRISLAREAIALSLSQQELAARLAGNNTNLGGVLTTDKRLSEDVVARLKKSWKENYGGLANAGETAVLEMGLKWQPLGMTGKDAEFVASRGFQVLEIARIYRMPPHKLGVMERMIGSTLEAIDQDYMNNTIGPYLERIESKLSDVFGLAAEELFIDFDVTRFLRASLQVRYNAYRTGIVGMFITPNEVRRAEGLPDVEGGDTLYQPTNVAPIGFEPAGSETGPGSDVTGKPAPGGHGDPAEVPSASEDAFEAEVHKESPLTLNINIDATQPAPTHRSGRLVRLPDGSAEFHAIEEANEE